MGTALDEVEKLLLSGISPSQIARKRGVAEEVTLDSIHRLVGRGRLRRSAILYSVPNEVRNPVLELLAEKRKLFEKKQSLIMSIYQTLRKSVLNLSKLDIEVVIDYSDARIVWGDLYEDIRDIELLLHKFVREKLEEYYGSEETQWWAKGIPKQIRMKCQERREESESSRLDPWCYTDLIDMKEIIDKQWAIISPFLSNDLKHDKKIALKRLNKIK